MLEFSSASKLKNLAKKQLSGQFGPAMGVSVATVSVTYVLSSIIAFFTNYMVQGSAYYIVTSIASILSGALAGVFVIGQTYYYVNAAIKYAAREAYEHNSPLPQYANINPYSPNKFDDIFWPFKTCPNNSIMISLLVTAITMLSTLSSMILTPTLTEYTTRTLINISPGANATVGDSGNALFFINSSYAALVLFAVLLIFWIANIYLGLVFSQVQFLLIYHPYAKVSEIFNMSAKMMRGSILRLLYLKISFIPLSILAVLTCGIGSLWILPYQQSALVNFSLELYANKRNELLN